MNGATTPLEVSEAKAIEKPGRELFSYWIQRCDEFLDHQRANILRRQPSSRELAEHIDALKFMIRVTLFLQAILADPDSPAQRYAPGLAGKLLQLQESLKLLQNPMTDAEADAVLQAAFPNGR